ncbi:hypothetical protein [Azospirillum sp. TSO22-1]|uniref:hypothetical protein n=1 Tax=Azospirillum sp. TSO22-1 TaxID=716789 RepID=UPI000D616B6D|nr:hypothetical protein [Azospirillum sp. TSO22-1]PWC54730.1 hypothetical protein TSO221_07280 [Azospirillum sp. TSO22-1]
MLRRLSVLAILLATSLPAGAETLACPDMSTAVQAGSCPTKAELEYGFDTYCAADARMMDKETVCKDFEVYRALKDTSLWEAGTFQGYLSCSLTPERIRTAKPVSVAVGRAGTVQRVACTYDNETVMAARTRAACTPNGPASVDCPAR